MSTKKAIGEKSTLAILLAGWMLFSTGTAAAQSMDESGSTAETAVYAYVENPAQGEMQGGVNPETGNRQACLYTSAGLAALSAGLLVWRKHTDRKRIPDEKTQDKSD